MNMIKISTENTSWYRYETEHPFNFVSSLVKKCDSILLLPVDSSYYKRSENNCHLCMLFSHCALKIFTYTHFFSNLFLHICYKRDGVFFSCIVLEELCYYLLGFCGCFSLFDFKFSI